MKRTKPLKRNKPLQSKTPLRSYSTLKSKSHLKSNSTLKQKKPISKKRSAKARAKDFTQETKDIVFERCSGICERCKVRRGSEYHHCYFRSDVTRCTNDISNCLYLCIWCHKEDPDSAHRSRETREWCVEEAKRLAEVSSCSNI